MKRETTVLLICVLALVLVGILMVYSASGASPAASAGLKRHLVFVAIGLTLMYIASRFDYHHLSDPIIFRSIVIFSMVMLVLVLVPGVGVRVDGAQRWLRVAGFQFQPSEIAKVALILLLAAKLAANQDRMKDFWSGFLPPMVIAAVFASMVVLERDLGMPIVLMTVAMAMILMAGARIKHLAIAIVPCIALGTALILTFPHRVRRLVAFADPWQYANDEGYQLIQSLMGFARGGVWGTGPGAGEQKLDYLYAAQTDFIFAVWAEEMGLVGTLIVVTLFATVTLMAFRIALAAEDLFGSLLAGGIAFLLALQASLNMAVSVGLVPTKGLPLPFISYGGSSLLVFLALIGVLLNIGLQAEPVEAGDRRLRPATTT